MVSFVFLIDNFLSFLIPAFFSGTFCLSSYLPYPFYSFTLVRYRFLYFFLATFPSCFVLQRSLFLYYPLYYSLLFHYALFLYSPCVIIFIPLSVISFHLILLPAIPFSLSFITYRIFPSYFVSLYLITYRILSSYFVSLSFISITHFPFLYMNNYSYVHI